MPAPHVDLRDLMQITDAGGYARGLAYFREGNVLDLDWDEEQQELEGHVKGSNDAEYLVEVGFVSSNGKRHVRSTRCSCPVRSGCKHVIAALLASNVHEYSQQDGARVAVTSAPPPTQPAPPSWRALVAPAITGQKRPLALGVELRHRAPRGDNHWAPRAVRPATPRDLAKSAGELLLAIRPLMRSHQTGAWIQGQASWDVVRRDISQFGRVQSRWFGDLLSISRDSLLSGNAGDWLVVDQIESGLLWSHLRSGAALGIPLVASQKNAIVQLADSAEVSATITRDEGGTLTVGADAVIDGRPIAAAHVHPIGRSGVYAAELIGNRMRIALAEVPLSEQVRALLDAPHTIVVPAEEEEAFVTEAYPLLARRSAVRTVGDVSLPEIPAPEPVLNVAFERGDVVSYSFAWSYRGFGTVPFAASPASIRDPEAEAARRVELESVWQEHTTNRFLPSGSFHDIDAAAFVATVVPAFEAAGVSIVTTGVRKEYRELTGTPEVKVTTVETTDSDWFDLGIIVTIDGRHIPFGPLFTALSRGKKKLLLSDGGYFSLNHPGLDRLRELIEEAGELDEWETGPRISRYQTDLWEEFEDLADEAQPAVSWRSMAEGLRAATGVPETLLPASIRAELRPYQKSGFDWLAFLWKHRLGGILADDMGLGKTLQLLTFVQHTRDAGEKRPFLVLAPTSVLSTWKTEAARFTPELRVAIVDTTSGTRRDALARAASSVDIIVSSYTVARLDEKEFASVEWAGLILDEAQFVKNPKTKLHRAIATFRADVTYAVTGTPMENSLSDLWALLKLAAPGLFPSARKFRDRFIQPIEKGKVPENEEGGEYRQRRLAQLRRRIRPLMLRRTKELVAADLPPKQEQVLEVELSPAHRALYDVVLQRERQKVLGLIDDLDRNRFIVFRSLTLLRMLSLAPGLVDENDADIGSGKLDTLIDRVSELRAEGHRALVFSQFTSFLDMAAARLDAAGVPYAHLDGSTRRRQDVVDGFRSGDQVVFLISLKAGGFGLTLTEADYVFLLDPWWNPAAEAQAIDRTHRIGQTNQVFVYRMIAAGTIEEKVRELQQRKARLFTAVMDDEELFSRSLTAEDIRGLFDD
ncbi:DEAD/DEAH box helicase [Microbacterium sp. W4I20]|uniref:DEAD/DEAH box helicase n=1 Tax=Microbacterium sp. W4I20 TaxID=3042262 RepID=UPI00278B8522|nr:DEAD/DEAH box helicase [Microbacterium sp. W4I20]MDQ0725436.1 superfamily II DNA or RNA helicase [Microbacterium sp. W4I20]